MGLYSQARFRIDKVDIEPLELVEMKQIPAGESSNFGDAPMYRYMSKGELDAIQAMDEPILRGGREGATYFTKDVYKSGEKAQRLLALPERPTYRVEFQIENSPTLIDKGVKVVPDYGQPGGGAQWKTYDQVKVRIINAQPIK